MFSSQRDILNMINIEKPHRNVKEKEKVQEKMKGSVFRRAFELWVGNTSWKQIQHNKTKIL